MTKPDDSMDELSLDQLVASVRKGASVDQKAGGGAMGESLRKGIVAYHAEQYQELYAEEQAKQPKWMRWLLGDTRFQLVARSAFAAVFLFSALHIILNGQKQEENFRVIASSGYDSTQVVTRLSAAEQKIYVKSNSPEIDSRKFFDRLKSTSTKATLLTDGRIFMVRFVVDLDSIESLEGLVSEFSKQKLEVGEATLVFEVM